ncbi:hypothetical protein WR25_08865 [Diploscapter pachys]|uniref:Uncharacterized protein n=1 Tax=Diploscapter pachys TaxID=2018661 RepID=A0A2A2JAV2_9BILA|nr:hypothetical protein WR25_08865 [Diploscapter pachys]
MYPCRSAAHHSQQELGAKFEPTLPWNRAAGPVVVTRGSKSVIPVAGGLQFKDYMCSSSHENGTHYEMNFKISIQTIKIEMGIGRKDT